MPNYGILQQLQPQQAPDLVGSFLGGMRAQDEAKARQAAGELAKLQLQTTQKQLDYLPIQQQMEAERHKQSLSMNALNMQATRQGMTTTQLQQAHLQQQIKSDAIKTKYDQTKMTHDLLGDVWKVPADQRPAAWQYALKTAKDNGLPIEGLPNTWDKTAESFAENAYIKSGVALKQLELQEKLASIQLKQSQKTKIDKEGAGNKNNQALNAYIKDLSSKAEAGSTAIQAADTFNAQANEVGIGTNPASGLVSGLISPSAQAAKQSQGDLVAANLKVYGANPTEGERKAAEMRSPSLSDFPAAREAKVQQTRAIGIDKQEHLKFANALIQQGITDQGTIESKWNDYRRANPIIDKKTGKVNMDNLTNWQDYLSGNSTQKQANNISGTVRRYNPATGKIE